MNSLTLLAQPLMEPLGSLCCSLVKSLVVLEISPPKKIMGGRLLDYPLGMPETPDTYLTIP